MATARTSATGPAFPYRITSGGFALFANGTGTASFDHLRINAYPDPALFLQTTGRIASSRIQWIEDVADKTTLAMKISTDGTTWTPVTNNTTIGSYNLQPDPTQDTFSSDTSANYTNTNRTGGATATVTYNTANSYLTLAGGTNGIYINSTVSNADVDILTTLNQSSSGGLVWRFVDASNFYYIQISDSAGSNTLVLSRVVANVRTQLASTPISFTHLGRVCVVRVRMEGNVISVYFDDDAPIISYTDATPLVTAGKMGFYNNGGTVQFYQLILQPLGDLLSGYLYLETDLTTTDFSVTPALQDVLISTRGPTIATGALIPSLHTQSVPFEAYFSKELDQLVQSSASAASDFFWDINNSKAMIFTDRFNSFAPQCINTKDLLYSPNIKPAFSSNLYRNRQTITNCTGTVTISSEKKIANGTDTSWQLQYPLYSAPSITVDGVTKTVGIQGTDTGKDFYWQSNSNSISQDTSATVLTVGVVLTFSYVGQFVTKVTRNNLTEQAARKTAEPKTSGIIEAWEDGKGMLVDKATIYADSLLARYAINNAVEVTCTTQLDTFDQGMQVSFFLPEFNLSDVNLFITKITVRGQQQGDGSVYYTYEINATNGPNLNRWASVLGY